jgi:hypothetical protein
MCHDKPLKLQDEEECVGSVIEVYFSVFRISSGRMQIIVCVSELSSIKTMHMALP